MRVIAVDWSGALANEGEKIWLAEAADGRLVDMWNGRTREHVCDFLIAEAREVRDIVVGLDFAFSLPAWYMRECGFATAPSLWTDVAHGRGEDWLRGCPRPFFGRKGTQAPPLGQRLRVTDAAHNVGGISPKSVFQIGGAGAVGTGSLRGMPVLHRLHKAGFSVWPFCDPRLPLVIEIWPRLLTGAVNKGNAAARREYMEREYGYLEPLARSYAASNEDAFDAAVSALVMWKHRDELAALPPARDDVERLEGTIWRPGAS